MTIQSRCKHSSACKAQAALETMCCERTVADELAQYYEVHLRQIADYKRLLLQWAADILDPAPAPKTAAVSLKEFHTKIGQRTLEKDFLHGELSKC